MNKQNVFDEAINMVVKVLKEIAFTTNTKDRFRIMEVQSKLIRFHLKFVESEYTQDEYNKFTKDIDKILSMLGDKIIVNELFYPIIDDVTSLYLAEMSKLIMK